MGKKISFIISNPNHHVKICMPVAQKLQSQGHEVSLISLCEFRRLSLDPRPIENKGITVKNVENPLFDKLKTSSGSKSLGGGKSFIRTIVQYGIWRLLIRQKLIRFIKKQDLVVTCNDYAAPFLYISSYLNRTKTAFVCLQEGIRFHQPGDTRVYYGTFGSDYLVAWGQNSVDHFLPVVKKKTKVVSLGTPIYDNIQLDSPEKMEEVRSQLSPATSVVAFLSNPVEDIGFGTKDEKLKLFEDLLNKLGPFFDKGLYLLLRVHPREDIQEFMDIAKSVGVYDQVINSQGLKSIFSTLSLAQKSIVMASTAGVDSLIANKPLAILKVYENDFGHDYVQSGAATPLVLNEHFDTVFEGFLSEKGLSEVALEYRDRNMINIGTAAEKISDFLEKEVLS